MSLTTKTNTAERNVAAVADPEAREFLTESPYRSLAVSYLFASEFDKGT